MCFQKSFFIAKYNCFIDFINFCLKYCSYCNCGNRTLSDLTTSTTTEQPVLNTTTQQYDIVNNPDGSIVDTPIDTSIPITQAACGIQIFSGKQLHIITLLETIIFTGSFIYVHDGYLTL